MNRSRRQARCGRGHQAQTCTHHYSRDRPDKTKHGEGTNEIEIFIFFFFFYKQEKHHAKDTRDLKYRHTALFILNHSSISKTPLQ